MPNGMGPAPIQVPGWKNLHTSEGAQVTSVHAVPIEQFIHELNVEGTCLCGPDVEYVVGDDIVIPMMSHFALDGRYYNDHMRFGDWDEGPRPPEPDNEPLKPGPSGLSHPSHEPEPDPALPKPDPVVTSLE